MHEILIDTFKESLQSFISYPELCKEAKDIRVTKPLNVLSIGKAAWQMANVFCNALDEQKIQYQGIVLTKYRHAKHPIRGMQILEAGHPYPDENSLIHTGIILSWLSSLSKEEDLVILLSGGGSALFEKLPNSITLKGYRQDTIDLLRSGCDIATLNKWRESISLVKGGKALKNIACREIKILCVSDVQNNPPRIIASAPFLPDNVDSSESLVVGKTRIYPIHSAHDQLISYRVIADNSSFLSLFSSQLRNKGLIANISFMFQNADAGLFAHFLVQKAHQMANDTSSSIRIFGGECPVKVTGSGIGGRCTHIALLTAKEISVLANTGIICLATDGTDGPSDAAGAYVNDDSASKLLNSGIDVDRVLSNCDSYNALRKINSLVSTGPTGTNVNDVYVVYRMRP